jgi:hypothetical protein
MGFRAIGVTGNFAHMLAAFSRDAALIILATAQL